MNKTMLVARREYLENVQTKSFWIGILFLPLMLLAWILVPILLEKAKDARRYTVVDGSGWLMDAVRQQAAAADLARVFELTVRRFRAGGDEFENLPDALRSLAPVLEPLDGESVAAFAQRIVAGPGGAPDAPVGAGGDENHLPEPASEAARAHRAEVLSWWWSVSAPEAKRLDRRLRRAQYEYVDVPEGQRTPEALNRRLADGDLFAYFVIPPDPVSGEEPTKYVSKNLTDDDLRDWFGEIATGEVRARRLAQEEISPQVVRWIESPLRFDARKVGESGREEEVRATDRIGQLAPIAFVYILWLAVFLTAQMLLTNTIEEKSNRTIEVLLSSVSPIELMAGKVAGIAATGVTVVGTWLAVFFVESRYLPGLLGAPPNLDIASIAGNPTYVASFLIYFVLGFLLYAAVLVMIGSVCNTLKEAQNMMQPITLLLIVPLLAMVPIARDPNGTLAVVLSYVPVFTPFVMMNRAAGPPTVLEYVVTTILLLAAIALSLWAAAKVFRIGVLMTGKPPRLTEVIKWIGAPVGATPPRRGSGG